MYGADGNENGVKYVSECGLVVVKRMRLQGRGADEILLPTEINETIQYVYDFLAEQKQPFDVSCAGASDPSLSHGLWVLTKLASLWLVTCTGHLRLFSRRMYGFPRSGFSEFTDLNGFAGNSNND